VPTLRILQGIDAPEATVTWATINLT